MLTTFSIGEEENDHESDLFSTKFMRFDVKVDESTEIDTGDMIFQGIDNE